MYCRVVKCNFLSASFTIYLTSYDLMPSLNVFFVLVHASLFYFLVLCVTLSFLSS